jgi:hypothetical protein
MSDISRLLSEGSQLERELLTAGRAERPSARSKQRATLALSVATGVSLWSRLALALRGALAGGPLVKITATLAVVGVASWAVVATRRATTLATSVATAARRAPAPVTSVALAPSDPSPTAVPALAIEAARGPDAAKPPLRAAPLPQVTERPQHDAASGSAADDLSAEVKAIDQARAALRQPQQTLRLLDAYARNYPQGRLQQEALVLRVQALLAAGERGQASLLVRHFREQHPASPYARRLASLVAAP